MPRPTPDGRYAPSPTGDLHVGNLRTALAAWCMARSGGARFVLRIDDLDPDRIRPESAARQLRDLAAIGIDWDGEPLVQSTQRAQHEAALDRLTAAGFTYPCFCTRADIRAAASAPHGAQADGAYAGTCRHLPVDEVDRRRARGAPHAVRVRAGSAEVTIEDQLLGTFSGVVDDFVVRRKDGVPAYNLATVVDDATQGVGEVVRGADLAETTPRQAWLAQQLGLPAVRYAHVPIVRGVDGTRLAKRHGAVTLADLAQRGLAAGDVQRLLAESLGIEVARGAAVTRAGLLAGFDAERIPREDQFVDPVRFSTYVHWADVQAI
ncbi:MAG: tRNA glutamyl-Q(34) synthetase GluQRS [Thermoleophilia bacterium]|nr:tRNA glutamyl-Q(34) synthetase GluQRS [Thermoleophilia bacterium]